MKKLQLLIQDIHKELPALKAIEKGQIFSSAFYGNIVATKITEHHPHKIFSIYGFDEKDGLPRDSYYPKDLRLVGKKPLLSDVLQYLAKKGNNVDLEHDRNILWIDKVILWDLRIPLLENQAESTIEKIFSLAFPEKTN